MNYFTLRKHSDNAILYEGQFGSFSQCLEDAVNQKIALPYINLKNRNLVNANIDGACMPYADFSGSNLTGANLSEAILHNANFTNASLYNCCMSYSDLHDSNFSGTGFGGTLIDNTDIRNCAFSTLSCFDLDFMHTKQMTGCTFVEPDNKHYKMSSVPVVIRGLFNMPVILFDEIVKIGEKTMRRQDVPQFLKIMETYTYKQAKNNKAA